MRVGISRQFAISFVALLALSASPSGQTSSAPASATPGPDATSVEEIMGQAMARARAQDETGAELGFESLILTTVDSIDGDEQVTETETSLHKWYPLAGSVYEELIEKDGKPLDEDELREEQKRRDEFREEAIAAAEGGDRVETDDERQLRFDEELMGRYRTEVVGQETLRGERCWVIDF